MFTKFGTYVPLVDVINPDKLCVNLFKDLDFTGVKVSILPLGNGRRRYNSAALRAACDIVAGKLLQGHYTTDMTTTSAKSVIKSLYSSTKLISHLEMISDWQNTF